MILQDGCRQAGLDIINHKSCYTPKIMVIIKIEMKQSIINPLKL